MRESIEGAYDKFFQKIQDRQVPVLQDEHGGGEHHENCDRNNDPE
jgi:hypothetical protein